MSADPSDAPATGALLPEYPGHQGAPGPRDPAPLSTEEDYMVLQPRFEQDLHSDAAEHGMYEFLMTFFGTIIGFLGSIPLVCCCPNPYQIVPQGRVGLISRFGKCIKVVDPGLHKINPVTESILRVPISLKLADIPRQNVITKDNVHVNIDSVLWYRVIDPFASSYLVADVHVALIERTLSALRQIIGQRSLQDCIEHRDEIAGEMKSILDEPAKSWGVEVESLLIKDLVLSHDLMENLSAAARQRRIGESKVIAAEAEVRAAELMSCAAKILSSETAMQMRYLETLQAMSKAKNARVIFTAPASAGNLQPTSARVVNAANPAATMEAVAAANAALSYHP